jgi:hypothetical protein
MARINVESDSLVDPRIAKRLPRFAGLSRFDTLGRLISVWALGYARKTTTLSEEDVDDAAEHSGFATAMVQAELAEPAGDGVVRVRGLADRIGYLLNQQAAAHKGGEARRKQLAEAPRGDRGKFVSGATVDHPAGGHSPPDRNPVGGHSPPDRAPTGGERPPVQNASGGTPPPTHHPIFSGSSSSPDLDQDLDLDLGGAGGDPAPPPQPASPKPKAKKAGKKGLEIPIPDTWRPNDGHRDRAAELRLNLDQEAQSFRDHALAKGRTLVDWDAGFRTWLTRSAEYRGGRGGGLAVASSRSNVVALPLGEPPRRKL